MVMAHWPLRLPFKGVQAVTGKAGQIIQAVVRFKHVEHLDSPLPIKTLEPFRLAGPMDLACLGVLKTLDHRQIYTATRLT